MTNKTEEKSIIVKITLDTKAAAIDKLKDELKGVNIQMKYLRDEGKVAGKEFQNLAGRQAILTEKIRDGKLGLKQATKEFLANKTSLDEQRAKLLQLNRQWDKMTAAQRDNSAAGKALKAQIESLTESVGSLEESTGRHQRSVGNYGKAFSALPGPIGSAITQVKGMQSAFVALSKVPLVAVILLIIGAIMAIGKAFMGSQEGIKKFKTIMAELHAIIGVIKDRMQEFGGAIVKIFQGNFREGFKEMKDSFKGIGEQINEAAKGARDYIAALGELAIAQNTFIVTSAKNRLKIAQLLFNAQDVRKTYKERKAAIQEAFRIEEDELLERKRMAEEAYDIEINKIASEKNLNKQVIKSMVEGTKAHFEYFIKTKSGYEAYNKITRDGFKTLQELYAEIYNVQSEFYETNKRNQGKLSRFDKEVGEEHKKVLEEKAKENDNLKKILHERNLITANEYDKEIMQLEFQKEERIAKMTENGENILDLLKEFDLREAEINKKYYLKQQETFKKEADERYALLLDTLQNEEALKNLNARRTIKDDLELDKELLRIQIEFMQKRLEATKEYYLEDKKITEKENQELISLQIQINNLILNLQKLNEVKVSQFDKSLQTFIENNRKEIEIAQLTAQSINNINQGLNDRDKARQEEELAMAGTNAAKKDAINQKYAKKYQNRAYAQAIINAALAITNAWTSGTWVENLIETAGIAIETGLQIDTIKKQKFGLGGVVLGEQHDVIDVRTRPGEVMLVPEAGRMFPAQLNAMNQAAGGSQLFTASAVNNGATMMNSAEWSAMIIRAIENMPSPVLTYKEFAEYQAKIVKIQERAHI